jgi:DNA-binding NarL/FixJ family response regulator/signal transduction histidine kinase
MTDTLLRILLVEDSPGDARLVELALEEMDLPVGAVSRVTSLHEAEAVLSSAAVDLVLLDLRLPDSSGSATVTAIREIAPEVPVVVLSSLNSTALAVDALRTGADEYLRKADLSGAALERAIRFALERTRREQRSRFVLRAVEALAATLDYEETLRSLAHLAVPALADWCVIELLEADGRLRVAEIVATDERKQAQLAAKLRLHAHGRPGGTHPVDEVLSTGQSRRCAVADEACRQRMAYNEAHLRLLRKLDPRSILVVPLVAGDRVLGTLSLATSESDRYYDAEDQTLAEELARQAGVAVASAQLYRESRHAQQRAESLAARSQRMERLSDALAGALTPQEVAAVVLTYGTEAVATTAGALLLLDEAQTALELLRASELPEDLLAAWTRFSLETASPLAEAVHTGRPVIVPDRERLAERYPELAAVLGAARAAAVVALPLQTDAGVLGVLVLVRGEARTLSGANDEFLSQCVGRCAAALERAVLFEREQHARQEAREAALARDEVLAIVAHDLRNPLGASVIHASLLRDLDLAPDQRMAAAGAILTSLGQMDKLIQDLLDISRLEAGRLEMTPSDLAPAELLRRAAAMMQAEADERRLELRVDATEGLPPVHADPDRVLQVFSNLLGNAFRFTPAGGTVSIHAEPLERETLFMVSDTGPGIAIADRPHLFDRFWQARHTRRGGAGLGLSIAKHLVELQGGRIGVESKPGVGSTFFFTLPAAPSGSEDAVGAEVRVPDIEEPDVPSHRVRVFLVDDHPVVRRGLKAQLRRTGRFDVVGEASSGEEAVQRAPLLRPDLVLMDLSLPGMSGIDAMREITRHHTDIKVLALTAEPEETALLPVLEAGGSGFVRKTNAHEDLVAAIETALRDEVFLYPSGNRLLLRDFRLQRETHEDPRLQTLTEHQRQVIALAAEGFTSTEIGKKLFLSPTTVDSYRSRAMHKLGLGNRAELVRFAVTTGLLREN